VSDITKAPPIPASRCSWCGTKLPKERILHIAGSFCSRMCCNEFYGETDSGRDE
jgi:hypothetical protein